MARFSCKILTLGALVLLMLIPNLMLNGLIGGRENWRHQAYSSIAQGWPGEQTLVGPVLIVPYTFTELITEKPKDGGVSVTREETARDVIYLPAADARMAGDLTVSVRNRGIYDMPVYVNAMKVTGGFATEQLEEIRRTRENVQWEAPVFAVIVTDQRGIGHLSPLQFGNQTRPFKPGSTLKQDGMHVRLEKLPDIPPATIPFSFTMELRGMRSILCALLAENTVVELSGNWPHPSFSGFLLPDERKVEETAFSAVWKASAFNYNTDGFSDACRDGSLYKLAGRAVGVDLVQPGDVYQQSERSIKYALLFILLTFGVMLLCELLHGTPLHPVQYTCVALALMIFYLLLISLSERIGFGLAYGAAATACTALLTCYFSAILRSRKFGVLLGSGIALLYAALYVILQSEDNALIMGSLLVFALLAALMLGTRHFDWYALTTRACYTLAAKTGFPRPEHGAPDISVTGPHEQTAGRTAPGRTHLP